MFALKPLHGRSFLSTTKGALLVGIVVCAGCSAPQSSVLGVAPQAQATATVAQLTKTPAAQVVTLHGEMIQKCPVAGCWFMLKDKTGVARVDTKSAGFVVSNVPLHTTMTVTGKTTPGSQPGLDATGLRY